MSLDLPSAIRLMYLVSLDTAVPSARLAMCVSGGVTALWLRDPRATPRELFDSAVELVPWCHRRGVALVVSDHVSVARASGADGVHVGRRSLPIHIVRSSWNGWLGASCHTTDELAHAEAAGADYATLSPVFEVPKKGRSLGAEGFIAARESTSLPVVALGGIEPTNARPLSHHAVGLAVRRALRDTEKPANIARCLREMTDA